LSKLKYRPRSDHDFDFEARARRGTIAAPVGPLRATLVLGDDAATGTSGACAISAALPCTATSSALRCR
jgi:hypothetical protein